MFRAAHDKEGQESIHIGRSVTEPSINRLSPDRPWSIVSSQRGWVAAAASALFREGLDGGRE